MSSLWVLPLLALLFVVGVTAALIRFLAAPADKRPKLPTLIAIPLGCVFIPLGLVVLIATIGALFKKSDAQLYEEIFGYRPTISEDRMLFDDFGRGAGREIYMRAEPTPLERKRILAIPGAVESDMTLDRFIGFGESHQFSWWLSGDEKRQGYCKAARIVDAHGFRGWDELQIALCIDAGSDPWTSSNKGMVYVIASGRID